MVMNLFNQLFGKGSDPKNWKASHRAILSDLTYDEIVTALGSPKKSKDGYIFWRGPLSDLDDDYDEDQFFQISDKNHNNMKNFISPHKRDKWFVIATSDKAVRILASEVGGIPKDVEAL